jgi:hypothetical protein
MSSDNDNVYIQVDDGTVTANDMAELLRTIADLIEGGFTSGYYPHWRLVDSAAEVSERQALLGIDTAVSRYPERSAQLNALSRHVARTNVPAEPSSDDAGEPTTSPAALVWQSAGTDNPGDQTADTDRTDHGYWSLGPSVHLWAVELIVQGSDLEELPAECVHLGHYETESAAKVAAAEYEASPDDVWLADQFTGRNHDCDACGNGLEDHLVSRDRHGKRYVQCGRP